MKCDKNRRKNVKWILPLAVLIVSIAVLYIIVRKADITGYNQIRTKAKLNAVTYADRMTTELNNGVGITNSLEQTIISENGKIDKFKTVAESMMNDYVQSIQIAPAGVVSDIYPEEGNEAGKIDLVHDETRGEIVRYGIKNDLVIMQGPFELKQGGYGIAIRNPVFLKNNDGSKKFWGLTIVIIRVPEIFLNSVNSLSEFGYDYCLYKTVSPLNDEYKMIDGSASKLIDPVSHKFRLGGCTWKLDVMPKNGWNQKNNMHMLILAGSIIILLLEGLVIALLIMQEQWTIFRRLAITDSLTGMLNRTGFNEQFDRYLSKEGSKRCIGIMLDVDNFKFINDVYGHALGDKVLKKLSESIKKTFSDNSILGRNGGDEFCIILKDTGIDEAKKQIESFCKAKRGFKYKGKEYNYSISLGYAEYPLHSEKGSELLRCADMALYEVKLKGKNGCFCYNNEIHSSKRTQLGFKLNDISLNLPGAFFIYKADRKNEQILYANQEMIQFVGCKDLEDFFDFTNKKFSGLVHPDEYQSVEESIWKQIISDEDHANDYVQYRMAVKDGSYKNVLDFGRIVDSEYYGSVFYVLVIDYDNIKEHYRLKASDNN